jgi:hypothetical protein
MPNAPHVAGPLPSEKGCWVFHEFIDEVRDVLGEQAALELVQRALIAIHAEQKETPPPRRAPLPMRPGLDALTPEDQAHISAGGRVEFTLEGDHYVKRLLPGRAVKSQTKTHRAPGWEDY